MRCLLAISLNTPFDTAVSLICVHLFLCTRYPHWPPSGLTLLARIPAERNDYQDPQQFDPNRSRKSADIAQDTGAALGV